MFARPIAVAVSCIAAITLAGCAGGNGLNVATGSLNDDAANAKKTKVSAKCIALYSKIDAIRSEGTPERIKKVAAGKSKTAVVKREALARVTELDEANQQLQSNCSRYTPKQLRAATPRPIVKAAKTPAATPVAKKKVTKAKTSTAIKPTKKKKTAATTPKPISALPSPSTKTKAATPVAAKTVKKTVTATKTATTTPAVKPIVVNAAKQAAKSPAAAAVVKNATATAGKSATTTATTAAAKAATTSTTPTAIPFPGSDANAVVTTTIPQ